MCSLPLVMILKLILELLALLYVPLKFEIYHFLMCIHTVDDILVCSVTKRKVNKLWRLLNVNSLIITKGSHEHQPRNVSVYVIIMFVHMVWNFDLSQTKGEQQCSSNWWTATISVIAVMIILCQVHC